MADASRVVTLGADLTQDQKNTMMQYFKANASEVQILTVTNADEREYLGNYIPLEQIGTRTLSCAYVKPTQSGGIKVRTANLNYVTGKMIANALSTAGISPAFSSTAHTSVSSAANGPTLSPSKNQLLAIFRLDGIFPSDIPLREQRAAQRFGILNLARGGHIAQLTQGHLYHAQKFVVV